ncbi:putative oxygen-independent coproporphyrinogen III oxidase [Selenomonas ruminantium subsp. lactilytica TAM6421]|uniref:Heme chaperone HemW n=1 Tax=Selenomonas ruminantium subsp. lactilytica (strain NBRC 103574 / TAM6421) TaxID=927704 RepID=I0GNK0_SELRL|nr:radical SAM family heme chaperone HemW [Selenomonas ruminantium]BAL82337.1 putative oxygen-independent coproporphyrinogen III oxidase [Selenomonas ruminantium subsp. lactilytica TAM6421]
MQWGVYIHIPFCRQKCFYCDFPSYAGRENLMASYTEALCQQIEIQGFSYRQKWGRPATVYIGGGTPTALPEENMAQILKAVAAYIGMGIEEFTVECNPGTVDAEYLQLLRAHGVNRLSFGVQSFNDRLLRRIGRIHTGAEAVEAVKQAQAAGFENISLDLIYGLPEQEMADLQVSVRQALALDIQHISIYGLQVEEGTVFARQQELGKLALPAEEEAEAMYDYMTEVLPQYGYRRYEVSNFAQAGLESRHNRSYWHDVPYLGLGAAAHSYLEGKRYAAVVDIQGYIAGIKAGTEIWQLEEEPTCQHAMEEFAFLALRTAEGLSAQAFAEKFQVSLQSVYGEVMEKLARQGLLLVEEAGCRLTEKGFKYGNVAFAEFILD